MVNLIYHPQFNITFPKYIPHPFDTQKYAKIFDILKSRYSDQVEVLIPEKMVSEEDLLKVHSAKYLQKIYHDKMYLSRAMDFPGMFYLTSMSTLQKDFVIPEKFAAAGVVQAAHHAMNHNNLNIVLGGGFHNAPFDDSVGELKICLIRDFPLACLSLRKKYPNIKIAMIDLDAHQGNGNADFAKDKSWIQILDMYNRNEYPWDRDETAQYIDFNIPLDGGHLEQKVKIPFWNKTIKIPSLIDPLCLTEKPVGRAVGDEEYLELLQKNIKPFLQDFKPDIVFYNAGTDPHQNDPWGCMNLTTPGIVARDEMVWREVKKHHVGMVITVSGGYAKDSVNIIATSLSNLIEKENNNVKIEI